MLNMYSMALGDYQTNCYFVWGDGDTCTVIDPGYEPQTILLQAKKLGKTIEAILLTHGHFDHIGAVREVAAETGCKVYVCEPELSMPSRLTTGPVYHTDTYKEGDVLTLSGVTFHVLQTPGHTAGSVCLLAEDSMFSGDTLFRNTCGRTDLPTGSWQQMQQSLKRLADLPKNYAVYPGHGPATTLDEEKQYNPYMQ